MINRRSFLSRSMVSAASFGVGNALSLGRRSRFRLNTAEAAALPTPYPVLVILLRGGLDPALHLVATPNGRYGNVVIQNRLSGTTGIKETAAKIRYAVPVVTPPSRADFEPHLNDVALLRSFVTGSSGQHAYIAKPWIGDFSSAAKASKLSWTSELAAQFRARGSFVLKPCAVAYPQPKPDDRTAYLDLAAWANQSPDPTTLADRILTVKSYFDAQSVVNLPYPRQAPAYGLVTALDRTLPAATQPELIDRFDKTNTAANDILNRSANSLWPLPAEVLTTFGLKESDLTSEFKLEPKIPQMLALAYQAFKNNFAHIVAFENFGYDAYSWDSHRANLSSQTGNGNILWSNLGKFLTLMKATRSPIDKDKTLFDTTNIWIQSEMGRTVAGIQPRNAQDGNRPDGTDHWAHACATFIGGRFRRGIAIGGLSDDWTSIPVNPATGLEAGGSLMTFDNLIATVMKAAGGDPSTYTKAAPIDALLNMSL